MVFWVMFSAPGCRETKEVTLEEYIKPVHNKKNTAVYRTVGFFTHFFMSILKISIFIILLVLFQQHGCLLAK